MFLDDLKLHVQAGKGGDGAVHFARIKFQPFAGPDGGDGGKGGSVALVADRNLDSLWHLRTATTTAKNGAPGAENQKIGVSAPDLELKVPVGTVVIDQASGDELGSLTAGQQRLVVALGGDGGKGNPKYATGRRRTPRIAEPGAAGEARDLELFFRLYCDTVLLEAKGDAAWQLLPVLTSRVPAAIDWELYDRRPRWLRLEHDFQRYDCGYLPLESAGEGDEPHCPLVQHVYWAQNVCLNLCPAGTDTTELALAAVRLVRRQPAARMERITLLVREACDAQQLREITNLPSECIVCPTLADAHAAFLRQLTGGTVA
jgi:hypothetical protein